MCSYLEQCQDSNVGVPLLLRLRAVRVSLGEAVASLF
jgi:hypothetical protein